MGEYIVPSSKCDGRSLSDNQQCLQCQKCPRGYYIAKPCPGNGTSSLHELCLPCKSCSAGQYRAGCNGDTFVDDATCAACPTCSQGQYIMYKCNGTEFSSAAQVCKVSTASHIDLTL